LGIDQVGVTDNFFELGGHSLSATRLISLIHKEFEVKLSLGELFEKNSLEEQAILVEESRASTYSSIPCGPLQSSYPLSSSQQRLWILSQFDEGNAAYNLPGFYEFEGSLDISLLESSFMYLLERHESLRTVFKEEEGEARQYILDFKDVGFQLGYDDLRIDGNESRLSEIVEEEKHKPFDLSRGPLLRIRLLQLSESKYVFILVMHHIISDGWSMEIMVKELFEYYESHLRGSFSASAPLRIHYKDYAFWQKSQLEGDMLTAHKSYWQDQFTGDLPVLSLPSQYPRPAVKTYAGSVLIKEIPLASLHKLNVLNQQEGSTLFMSLLSMVNVLLYRYSGQDDIIIGSAVTAREHFDLSDQIGFYINTLPLRTRFKEDDNFRSLLGRVKKMTLDAYAHQAYPLDELISDLSLTRDVSRNALFDVMVDLQNNHTIGEETSDRSANQPFLIKSYEDTGSSISRFDLHFNFSETPTGLVLGLTYNSDIYSNEFMVQLLNHFEQVLEEVISAPDQSISGIDYLMASEKDELVHDFNATSVEYSREHTIIDLFESQVCSTPDKPAVIFGTTELSYQKLNERSNQLALYLRDKYSIVPGDLIGIRMERSDHMIVVLLGILKSGAGYVPIDPQYPQERIDYMQSSSNCKVILDEEELMLYNLERFRYGMGNPERVSSTSDLAYVIYTSGSTGQPKGVMVDHGNLYNYLMWGSDYYFSSPEAGNFGLFSSLSFDLTITSIFLPLVRGNFIKVLSPEQDIYEILHDYLTTPGLDTIKLTPSHLELLKDVDFIGSSLKTIIVGGEPLLPQHVTALLADHQDLIIYNEYGPTESTVGCMVKKIEKDSPITIGSPISNTQVYLLDEGLHIVPIGVTGTLYVSGLGVTRGYLNRADLSTERFIANPFETGLTMYNTGDLGRWLPDGEIEYLGRKDDQVKIRGYRIELGEIETTMSQFSQGIKQVVASAKEIAGEKVLAAYYTKDKGSEIDKTELKAYLQSKLPEYMIPGFFVEVESIALTSNGKIDRKSLPGVTGEDLIRKEYVAPGNDTEKRLAVIWQEVLRADRVSITDSFFELGGHSLSATRLITLIHKEFNVKISLSELFEKITLEQQAIFIENVLIVKESLSEAGHLQNSNERENYTI
ncbi:amino acid adenylation domain-containing protein, partial [Chryseobacterium sp. SIMBA_029]|uniref:non-ribosomal peptide synthetase n=2 Tax=Pseudomonadati TaxID=3379134 RepID=UPI00397AFB89